MDPSLRTVALRERLAGLCITQMSAGSSTTPGGYGLEEAPSGEQFPVNDQRSAQDIAQWLEELGIEPVWSFVANPQE